MRGQRGQSPFCGVLPQESGQSPRRGPGGESALTSRRPSRILLWVGWNDRYERPSRILSGPGPAGETGRRRTGRRHRSPKATVAPPLRPAAGRAVGGPGRGQPARHRRRAGLRAVGRRRRSPPPHSATHRRDGQGPGRRGRPARADRRDHFQFRSGPTGWRCRRCGCRWA